MKAKKPFIVVFCIVFTTVAVGGCKTIAPSVRTIKAEDGTTFHFADSGNGDGKPRTSSTAVIGPNGQMLAFAQEYKSLGGKVVEEAALFPFKLAGNASYGFFGMWALSRAKWGDSGDTSVSANSDSTNVNVNQNKLKGGHKHGPHCK